MISQIRKGSAASTRFVLYRRCCCFILLLYFLPVEIGIQALSSGRRRRLKLNFANGACHRRGALALVDYKCGDSHMFERELHIVDPLARFNSGILQDESNPYM